MTRSTATRPVCALADAYGPCAAYRVILAERGYDIVHVQTYGDVSPYLAANHDSGFYLADVVHSGDPAITAERIRRSWQIEFLVPGLETGFHTANSIAAALGLPHNEGFHEPWSKSATYEALRAAGVPAARYLNVAAIDDIDAALEWASSTCGYPVVSKPPESAGADDVHICSDAEHLARAIRGTLGRKNTLGLPNRSVVLQEFLRGEEYIVDTVSRGGEHYVCLLLRCHKRLVGDGRMIYDRCELIPREGNVADVLSSYIKQVLDALKYHEGPAHSEVMLTEQGPRLIETNPRLDGGLSPEAEAACVGYGQRELTIDAFSTPDLWRAKSARPYRILQQMMLVCGISEKSGTLLEIPMAGWLPGLPSYFAHRFRIRVGDELRPTVDLASSPVHVYLIHPDREQILRDYNAVTRMMKDGFVLSNDSTYQKEGAIGEEHRTPRFRG